MLHARFIRLLTGAVVGACLVPAAAMAQNGPPPPTSTSGHPVTTLAQGLGTPTSFAFGAGTTFLGTAPSEEPNGPIGGLYVLKDGKAIPVEGLPPIIFGLVWHKGTLYVSTGSTLFAASGWDGTKFGSTKVLYKGSKKFAGFNGLAFGPNGRLYAGVSFGKGGDNKLVNTPYAQSVVSMKPNGKDIQVVTGELRQPFQLTFVKGHKNPFVSVLSNEKKPTPPDWVIVAKPNQNYGFPTCNWAKPKTCRGLPKPLVLLPDHASPMGISPIGQTLYLALFGGLNGSGPEVVSMNTKGKNIKPVLKFAAPVVAVGTNNGTLYTGDVTGSVYSVQP
jgi:glucose/arabinose dehydrogenase